MREIVRGLVDAVDPDTQARVSAGTPDPAAAVAELLERAIEPLAANPELRARIMELRTAHDRVIDEVSRDRLIDAHGVVDTEPGALDRGVVVGVPGRAPGRDHRDPAGAGGEGPAGGLRRHRASWPTGSPARRTAGRPT